MTVSLSSPAPAPGDPVDALLACHERIRRFGAMAARLVTLPEADPEALADGALRVHRYFATALPLHVADEEISFVPRLEPVASPGLRATLDELSSEHEVIEEIVSRLLPGWRALITRTGDARSQLAALEKESLALEPLLRGHVALEEEEVFPHLRRLLSPEQLATIAREMRERRATI